MNDAPHPVLDLERFLPYRLSVLSNRISADIAGFYRERFGLSVTEWRAMAILGRYPGASGMDITERTAMDKVAVSRAVNGLIDRGLVEREFDRSDRRRSILTLSAKGQAIYDQIAPLALRQEASLLAALDAADRQQLWRLLDKLDAAELRGQG